MPKIKDLLPSIFGGGGGNTKESQQKATSAVGKKEKAIGKLETDAAPVLDDVNENTNESQQLNNTPTVSTELTESVVRELTDPNYNSLELAAPNGGVGAGALATNLPTNANLTANNTMNVHNAQQQVIMQFSNANNLHFGSVFNYNNNNAASCATSSSRRKSSSSCTASENSPTNSISSAGMKKQLPRKTPTIVAMMQCRDEPNHRMLDAISTHLGEGWKQVMRNLGHTDGQIEQAYIDHHMHGGVREVIYQLLLQWLQNADDDVGTLGHITQLLWESNHRQCVMEMRLVWKEQEAKQKQKLTTTTKPTS